MAEMTYNPNNTEGAHDTAFEFRDTELRKGAKAVATDLVNLYDVELIDLADTEVLGYDETLGKWTNVTAPSGGCNTFIGYSGFMYVDFINGVDIEVDGSLENPFKTIGGLFDWLITSCAVVPPDVTITIQLLNDYDVDDTEYWNFEYGDRFIIDGDGYTISLNQTVDYDAVAVPLPINNVRDITTSGNTSHVIKNDGTLMATGYANGGALGISGTPWRIAKYEEVPSSNWLYITNGYAFTIGIKNDGTLWATGGGYGIGLGNGFSTDVFVQVGTDTDWAVVGSGHYHTLLIKTDGTLWGCGLNRYGSLGLEDYDARYTFVQIGSDTDWEQVSGGREHSLAKKTDGTIWTTGDNWKGVLGSGDTIDKDVFTKVGTDTDWDKISAGNYHSLVTKTDGTLWACGYNSHGMLGFNDQVDRHVFTQVGTDTDHDKVIAGHQDSFVIKTDKSLWGCGGNERGELGLGDQVDRYVFTQVGTDTDWYNCDITYYHTVVCKTDGTVWSSGENNLGELGDGTWGDKDIFSIVTGDTNYNPINTDDLNTTGNIFLSNNHSLQLIKDVTFKQNITLNATTGNIDDPADYVLNFMNIYNNSSIIAENVTIEIELTDTILTSFSLNKFTVKNSSHLDYSGDDVVVLNNSSLRSMAPEGDLTHLVKNGSVVITDDVTKFDDTIFINSQLIEYK